MANEKNPLGFGQKMSEYKPESGENTQGSESGEAGGVKESGEGKASQSDNSQSESKPDTSWVSKASEHFKMEFKTPDDFKPYFEKAKKVDEYEPKIKEYEASTTNYKKQLEELQRSLEIANNPLSYFSSESAWVAEQLRKQHPDKNPSILQEVVTADSKSMDDISVLVKNQLLETPDLIGGEQGAKEYILDKYGIDPSTPESEWSIALKNKIKIEANTARKQWSELKSSVKLPQIKTAEQKQAEQAALVEQKAKAIKPIADKFSDFKEFTEDIEEGKQFKFIPPDEYKAGLPEMMKAYFVDAGNEVNEENLSIMNELRDALLLKRHFKQIYKTIEADVSTREKAKYDALLNNEHPGSTQSAAELESDKDKQFSNQYGFGKLLGKGKK